MNLDLIRPKKEAEGLLLSITKNCETLIKQTHRKHQGTFDCKITKPNEIF